jgi:hypothetical protein
MYNHDYSESCGKSLARATKNNPCPHCGKHDWCYSIGDLSVCKRDHEPAIGWEKTSKCDGEGSFYYAPAKPEPWVKPLRPIKTTHYNYPDRLGNPLVRVVRQDTGNGEKSIYQEHWDGKQWIKGLGGVKRENIPIYRYKEVKEAIARGETIFIVEGEGKVDLLWSLAIPATCNIAGSGKWRPSDSEDLKGATVILCPDRDVPGVKHCEAIAKDFLNAQWLYCFPNSPLWHHLPDSKGADLKDWVDEGAGKEDIINAIGEKKALTPQKTEKSTNVVTHPKFTPKPLETDELSETIDNLIKEGVIGSKREIKLSSIAREYGLSQQQISSIYKERIKELERSEGYDDAIEELEKLAISDHARVNLLKILPEKLANGINHHARLTGLRPEAYLTALLTGLSSTLHPDTALSLYPQTDWKVPPNLYCAIVALSGEGKSIIGRAMISDPLKALNEKDDQDYERKIAEHKAKLANYEMLKKSKNTDSFPDGPPTKPTRRIRYFGSATGEGIARYAASNPDKGMLLYKDELAGLFKSANQYRGGRGSDSEDILEYYDGTPPITLRADTEKTVVCRKILLSIFGTIQPGVLEKLLGDKEDHSGQWSRFIFCQLPPSNIPLDIDAGTVDLGPMLTDLYRQFDHLPPAFYQLSRPAREKFLAAANRLKKESESEQHPAMRNVLIKARGLIGRLALNLHLLNSLFEGITPSIEIGVKTIENAIELADFYVSQVQGMYVRLSDDLPSHYARLLSVAGDWITPNNARKVAFSGKTKAEYPSSRIAEVFKELSDKGYGETRLTTRGSIEFRAFKGDNLIPPAKPLPDKDSEIKGDKGGIKGDNLIPPTEPLPSKDYSLKGDKGDKKNHFTSENLSPLTDIPDKELSPLTEKSKRDNTLSPLSPLSPQVNETQSQQDFTRGDKLKSPLSPLSPLSPQDSETDSDHPPGDTDNLKPDDYCFFKGRCHTVISVDGDKITVKDWYEKDNPSCLPFTVSLDEVTPDTPGPKREKKKKAK